MTASTEPAGARIIMLDVVRGVAVMGILAMNIIGFALPESAYMNPTILGMDDRADFLSWALSFIFIDGKMRGLFSFLFGASMLLVIERAEAQEENPARIHYRRMIWLLLFGALHFYLIWWGDILFLYAAMGMMAWFFRHKNPYELVKWGIAFVLIQFLLYAALTGSAGALRAAVSSPGATAEQIEAWAGIVNAFGAMSPDEIARDLALYRGSYADLVSFRVYEHGFAPINGIFMLGFETLGYFLLGMAALKSGFITGGWSRGSYRKVMLTGFGVGIAAYATMAWYAAASDFETVAFMATVFAGSTLVRPAMIYAMAALIILLASREGWLRDRIAAAGRAAFTNYLGTSIVMTILFYGYGFGLYGRLDRAELWLVVIPAWAAMLLWSKPWLDRFLYGPFEWLWRSLSRGKPQPMRRRPEVA